MAIDLYLEGLQVTIQFGLEGQSFSPSISTAIQFSQVAAKLGELKQEILKSRAEQDFAAAPNLSFFVHSLPHQQVARGRLHKIAVN